MLTARFCEQRHEAFLEVDVLAGAGGRIDRIGQRHPLVGELPGDHVLVPGQRELVERLAQADARLQADVAEVIDGQRHLIADHRAHVVDIVDEQRRCPSR